MLPSKQRNVASAAACQSVVATADAHIGRAGLPGAPRAASTVVI